MLHPRRFKAGWECSPSHRNALELGFTWGSSKKFWDCVFVSQQMSAAFFLFFWGAQGHRSLWPYQIWGSDAGAMPGNDHETCFWFCWSSTVILKSCLDLLLTYFCCFLFLTFWKVAFSAQTRQTVKNWAGKHLVRRWSPIHGADPTHCRHPRRGVNIAPSLARVVLFLQHI